MLKLPSSDPRYICYKSWDPNSCLGCGPCQALELLKYTVTLQKKLVEVPRTYHNDMIYFSRLRASHRTGSFIIKTEGRDTFAKFYPRGFQLPPKPFRPILSTVSLLTRLGWESCLPAVCPKGIAQVTLDEAPQRGWNLLVSARIFPSQVSSTDSHRLDTGGWRPLEHWVFCLSRQRGRGVHHPPGAWKAILHLRVAASPARECAPCVC